MTQELKVEADDLDRAKERVAASHLIASIQQRLDRSVVALLPPPPAGACAPYAEPKHD